jgi:hypothetical protein
MKTQADLQQPYFFPYLIISALRTQAPWPTDNKVSNKRNKIRNPGE